MSRTSSILDFGFQRSPHPSSRPSLPCTPGEPVETFGSFPDGGPTYGQTGVPAYDCLGFSREHLSVRNDACPDLKRPRLLGSGCEASSRRATVGTAFESPSVLHAYLQWASSSPLTAESCPSAPASGPATNCTSRPAGNGQGQGHGCYCGQQQHACPLRISSGRTAGTNDQVLEVGPARAAFGGIMVPNGYFATATDATLIRTQNQNDNMQLLLHQQQQLLLMRQYHQQLLLQDQCRQQLPHQNQSWQVTLHMMVGPATMPACTGIGAVRGVGACFASAASQCAAAPMPPAGTGGKQPLQLAPTARRYITCRAAAAAAAAAPHEVRLSFIPPTTPPLDADGPRECILQLCKALCMAECTTGRLALHIWHRVRGMVRLLVSVRPPAHSSNTAGRPTAAVAAGAERMYSVAALWLAAKLEERRREVPAVQTLAAAARTLPSVLVAAELRVLQWCEWSPYAGFMPDDSHLLIDL